MPTMTNPLSIIPIVGSVLSNIFSTVQIIVDKVDEVKINKRQCQTLIQRIQTVTSYLQTPQLLKQVQSNTIPLHQTLEDFQRFLEQCLDYISSFVDHSRLRNFIFSSNYKEAFTLLNHQLQIYYLELTLGININNLIDKNQDEYDQKEDLHELLTIIIQQQNLLTYQQNVMFHHQIQRFNQLEQMLAQKNDQLQLEYDQKVKSIQENEKTIVSTRSNDIFKNGIWSNRCFEYGKWHGPFRHQMTFNSDNNTSNGYGEDHIGSFTVTGTFSKETQQIETVLSYKSDTKSSQSNAGHQYRFEMRWNEKLCLFEGLKYEPVGWITFSGGLFEMSFIQAIDT